MIRLNYFCFLFFFISYWAFCQSEIKGIVVSNTGESIYNANILLVTNQDDTEAYALSKKDGSFVLKTNLSGNFKLKITALGWSPIIQNILLKKNENIELGKITLPQEKVSEIKEVVIQNKAVIHKKDTIEYKAQRFANGTEMNVEDLLRRIPELKIDSDGKIKVGDTEVSSVMIENDDLFERGYQTLTQNMPSEPIDKIQILKKYSKNKLLKGIENSESIALNLLLKKNAKGKWFGSTLLASTSYIENKQQMKFNLMNFTKKQKIYLLYNANNIGLNEMKGVEYLVGPSYDNSSENIGNRFDFPLINLHQKNYSYSDLRTNFNNDKLASINYIYNTSQDWKIKLVSIFNTTANSNFINSQYRFDDGITQFTNIEHKTWKQTNDILVGKIELTKDFKKNANLVFYNKLSSINENNENSFIFNDQPNYQNGSNKLWTNEHKIAFTKKIDSARAFVAVAKYQYQHRPYNFTEENDVFQTLLSNPNANKIHQNLITKSNYYGMKTSYLQRFSEGHSLEIQLGNEYNRENAENKLVLLDIYNTPLLLDNSLYNNLVDFKKNNLQSTVSYMNKYKDWNFNINIINQYISTDINSNNNSGYYFSPNIGLRYEKRNIGKFAILYFKNYSSSNIKEAFVNYLYTGNRSFSKSDLGYKMLPSDYFSFSFENKLFFGIDTSWEIAYSKYGESFSTNMIIQPQYTMSQTILVKDNEQLNSKLFFKKYFNFIKSKISIGGEFNKSEYSSMVNYLPLTQTKFSNKIISINWKTGWLKDFNLDFGYEWKFNKIISEYNNQQFINQKGSLQLDYVISKNLIANSSLDYYKFGQTNQKSTLFWDIKLDYLLKAYKMNLFIKGYNLLNVKSIQTYSVSNISESLYEQQLMPMSILVGVNKNF